MQELCVWFHSGSVQEVVVTQKDEEISGSHKLPAALPHGENTFLRAGAGPAGREHVAQALWQLWEGWTWRQDWG